MRTAEEKPAATPAAPAAAAATPPAGQGPPAPDAAGIAFFEQNVRPVLQQRCFKCHSAQAEKLQGGLHLDSRPGWQQGGDSGQVIIPGKPDESLLVRGRYSDDEETQMPPGGKLPESEIAALTEWVRLAPPIPAPLRPGRPKSEPSIWPRSGSTGRISRCRWPRRRR